MDVHFLISFMLNYVIFENEAILIVCSWRPFCIKDRQVHALQHTPTIQISEDIYRLLVTLLDVGVIGGVSVRLGDRRPSPVLFGNLCSWTLANLLNSYNGQIYQ